MKATKSDISRLLSYLYGDSGGRDPTSTSGAESGTVKLSTRQHHSVDKFILSVTFFVLQPGSFLCHVDRDFSMSYRLRFFYVISTEIFLCHIDRAERVEISIFYDVSEKICKFVG